MPLKPLDIYAYMSPKFLSFPSRGGKRGLTNVQAISRFGIGMASVRRVKGG